MTKPIRIQLSRKRGFNLQEVSRAANGLEAIKVDRSTGLGNPFPVVGVKSTHMGVTTRIYCIGTWTGPALWFKDRREEAIELSVKAYRAWITAPGNATKLTYAIERARGKNLACWCGKGPCHAEVLLELANK